MSKLSFEVVIVGIIERISGGLWMLSKCCVSHSTWPLLFSLALFVSLACQQSGGSNRLQHSQSDSGEVSKITDEDESIPGYLDDSTLVRVEPSSQGLGAHVIGGPGTIVASSGMSIEDINISIFASNDIKIDESEQLLLNSTILLATGTPNLDGSFRIYISNRQFSVIGLTLNEYSVLGLEEETDNFLSGIIRDGKVVPFTLSKVREGTTPAESEEASDEASVSLPDEPIDAGNISESNIPGEVVGKNEDEPVVIPDNIEWLVYHQSVDQCFPTYQGPAPTDYIDGFVNLPQCDASTYMQTFCLSQSDGSPSRCQFCETNLYICGPSTP